MPDAAGVPPPISAECHAALPWLGVHRGRQAVKEFLVHMHHNLEITAFGPREVISEGNKGAVFGWFRLHAVPTGRTADVSNSIRVARPFDRQISLPGKRIREANALVSSTIDLIAAAFV